MKLDLTGQRFGRFTVVRPVEKRNGLTMWLCRCDCGKEKEIRTTHLRNGRSKSCCCYAEETLRNRSDFYPKELRVKRLYRIWHNMTERCNNKNNAGFKNYGGRGITVCSEWNNYETFARWALNNGYKDNLTIDRIDNDSGYSPNNCRWATMEDQVRNRRNNRYETINGTTKTVAEWAREYRVNAKTVTERLDRGLDIKSALSKESYQGRNKVQIKCVETGEVFQSISDAAMKYNGNRANIGKASLTGVRSCGVHWERIRD